MKKLLLFSAIVTMISCGKSHEEQMLYNYQRDNFRESLNLNIEDLDLEIHSIEKVSEIKASDSIAFYKEKLANLWSTNLTPEEKDTLSYSFVIQELDTLRNTYQEIILANIRANQSYKNYEWREKRNQMIEAHSDAVYWKAANDIYAQNPDSILSVKYKASYSVNNPLLNNARQTFDKYFYSDSENEVFIKEEMAKGSN